MDAAGEPGPGALLSVFSAVVRVKWNHSRKIYDLLLGNRCSYRYLCKMPRSVRMPTPTVQEKKGLWKKAGSYLDEDGGWHPKQSALPQVDGFYKAPHLWSCLINSMNGSLT